MKMEASAAFGLRVLICRAHQLDANLAVGGDIDPGITIDEEGTQPPVGIGGMGELAFW
jgi:hypothetical protein